MSEISPEEYVGKIKEYFVGSSGNPAETVDKFLAFFAISSANGYPSILESQVVLFSRAFHSCSEDLLHLENNVRGLVFGAFFTKVLSHAPADPSFCESSAFAKNCRLSLFYFGLAESLWAQDPHLSKLHDWNLMREKLIAFAKDTIGRRYVVSPESSQQGLLATVLSQFSSGYRAPYSLTKFLESLCNGVLKHEAYSEIPFPKKIHTGPEFSLRQAMAAEGRTYVSSGSFHHAFKDAADLIWSIPYQEKNETDTRARDLRLLQEARPSWGPDKLRVQTGEVFVMPHLPYEPSDRVMAQFLLNKFYEGRLLVDGVGDNARLEAFDDPEPLVFDNGYFIQPPSLRPLSPRSNEVWEDGYLMGVFADNYYPLRWGQKLIERAAVNETLFYLARLFTHEFLTDTFGEHLKDIGFIKQVHTKVIVPHCRPATGEVDKTVLPPPGLVLEKAFKVFFERADGSAGDDTIESCRIDLAILLAALHSRFSFEEYEAWQFESPMTADAEELPVLFLKVVGLMGRHSDLTAAYLPLIQNLKSQLSGSVLLASATPESVMGSHVFLEIDLGRVSLVQVDSTSGAAAGAGQP